MVGTCRPSLTSPGGVCQHMHPQPSSTHTLGPVLSSMKQPVPYVFFASPSTHRWPATTPPSCTTTQRSTWQHLPQHMERLAQQSAGTNHTQRSIAQCSALSKPCVPAPPTHPAQLPSGRLGSPRWGRYAGRQTGQRCSHKSVRKVKHHGGSSFAGFCPVHNADMLVATCPYTPTQSLHACRGCTCTRKYRTHATRVDVQTPCSHCSHAPHAYPLHVPYIRSQ